MSTRETKAAKGRRVGIARVARLLEEFRIARVDGDVSIRTLARELGWSDSATARVLSGGREDLGITALHQVAAVLGFEVSVALHPVGEAVRDSGQLRLGVRFDSHLSKAWGVTNEAPLPIVGDQRAWDKLLRLVGSSPPYLVGVDLETRVRDIQALTRRTRLRERDGGVDAILIVLSDTSHNRRTVDQLRSSLGDSYNTPPRAILKALRSGERLVGSGVLLI